MPKRYYSCRHQGIADLKRHEKTISHAIRVRSMQGSSKLRTHCRLSVCVMFSVQSAISNLLANLWTNHTTLYSQAKAAMEGKGKYMSQETLRNPRIHHIGYPQFIRKIIEDIHGIIKGYLHICRMQQHSQNWQRHAQNCVE